MGQYTETQMQQFAADQREADAVELRLLEAKSALNKTGFMSESNRRRIRQLKAKFAA